MNSSATAQRARMLNAMGLGPLWVERQAALVPPVPVLAAASVPPSVSVTAPSSAAMPAGGSVA
ncbi:uracil-DNA glycosylase, partial [Undibacterium sp. 5I1]|nr:uracil-DNA glycosylase [Undibacterium sp. 5I1]